MPPVTQSNPSHDVQGQRRFRSSLSCHRFGLLSDVGLRPGHIGSCLNDRSGRFYVPCAGSLNSWQIGSRVGGMDGWSLR